MGRFTIQMQNWLGDWVTICHDRYESWAKALAESACHNNGYATRVLREDGTVIATFDPSNEE